MMFFLINNRSQDGLLAAMGKDIFIYFFHSFRCYNISRPPTVKDFDILDNYVR